MANILLVEDDEMISRMISLRLQMRGHSIDLAQDGKSGMEKALTGGYDLVLMDMHMPVMDGHEAVRQLRQQGYDGIIVAITASAMSSDSEKAIQAGCNAHLSKPIGNDFEDRLEAMLASN